MRNRKYSTIGFQKSGGLSGLTSNFYLLLLSCLGLFLCLGHGSAAQTLNDYLTIAAENNPGLQASYLEFEAALQEVVQARALPDPSLSFGYFISPVETRVGPQRAKFSLVQMFPWFGTNGVNADVREFNAQTKYYAFLAARNDLFLRVKEAYYPMYEVMDQIEWKNKNLEILHAYKRLATTNFSSGKGSLSDAIRVDIMIENMQTEIKLLEDRLTPLRINFNRLLNRDDASDIRIINNPEIHYHELTWSEDSVLAQNPLIDQLEMSIEKEKAVEISAQKRGAPSFGIGVDYVIVDERSGLDMPDNGKNVFMPMVSMSLPLFRKKYRSSVRQSQLQQEALVKKKTNVENQLIASMASSRYERDKALELLKLYDSQIMKTQQVIDLLNTSYANSGQDFEEILRMEQQLLKYNIAKATAVKDYFLATAKLDYLTAKNLDQ